MRPMPLLIWLAWPVKGVVIVDEMSTIDSL